MKSNLITSALLAFTVATAGEATTLRPQAAAASTQPAATATPTAEEQLTPEQRMARRFPQPAQVRWLVGRPVLDDWDNVIGTVSRVVRTRDGRIQLIVRYGGWFGRFGWWQRPVAVPIELVALIGPSVAAIDMPPAQFLAAPTWEPSADATELAPGDVIRVAITRR